MLFQAELEFTRLFIGIVISIIIFAFGIFGMRWYARKKYRSSDEVWDTSLKTAFVVNTIWLIIDIPIIILFSFLFTENLLLYLIIQFYKYIIIDLFIGTLAVTKFYKKKLAEAFDFVIIVQLTLFVISIILIITFTSIPNFLYIPLIFRYIVTIGLPYTMLLTALGLLCGFGLGILLAIMRVYGGIELKWFSSGYEKLFRGIPLLVLIYIFVFGMPGLFWYLAPLDARLASVVLALALRSGAYQSQIFRGAILSVNPGQMEAARALGMKGFQAFRHVVMPQALRLAVPSWSNEYAVVIKDSSFASAIGIIDMTQVAYLFSLGYHELWALSYGVLAVLYLLFTYPVTKVFGERQSKKLKN
ncbi:MAG: amino acid ABC transporter permease [Promethearchaeota archaeon]